MMTMVWSSFLPAGHLVVDNLPSGALGLSLWLGIYGKHGESERVERSLKWNLDGIVKGKGC